ncbi:MAG: DUF2828 family protein [Myxococcota bacterium]
MDIRPDPLRRALARFPFFTEKGALSHASTGAALLDYFSKAGTLRGRPAAEVAADLDAMWAESPQLALMTLFWVRLVTRKVQGPGLQTEAVQKGQGSRDEFRKGLVWLAERHRPVYDRNLWLVPLVGRWSDLWHEDVVEALPRDRTLALLADGLANPTQRALIAKYLPRLRSRGQRHTPRHEALAAFAKDVRKFFGWTEQQYRRFKSDPEHTAHQFQRDLCAGRFEALRFEAIPGRALFLLNRTGRDGLDTFARHGQEDRYVAWLDTQPTAKFTGYVHELYRAARKARTLAQKRTLDKQFDGLVATAKADRGGVAENVWCALDTSGSMQTPVAPDSPVQAIDVCLGLGLYFSALNEGAFRDHVVMFDSASRIVALRGTFTERVAQLRSEQVAWGSTNFQSVIDRLCALRAERPDVPASEFPTTLLVVSDMQFDAARADNTQTNYEAAMRKLAAVGLPEMRIVWWWVTGRAGDFPATLDDRGVILVGGFDGAILELLLGGRAERSAAEPNVPGVEGPEDAMLRALDQEILRRLTV